jgi:peptidoglycan/xylan/chitin deacetylase (PgdA/CDA1 family)
MGTGVARGARVRHTLLALLLFGCAAPDEDAPVVDDVAEGDSLDHDPEGKADGFTVPASLGLDKRGILYLTFDDGPSAALTPRILDTLARRGVRATFFVTGANIAGNERLLRRARDEGHLLANHQWRHVVAGEADFRAQVPREREALAAIVGEMPLYFRYPYGAMTRTKEALLREWGYVDGGVGWDIDSLDWDFGPDGRSSRREVPAHLRADFEGWVISQAERRGGGVVLLHDVQSITASRLDSLLGKLAARGFRFGQLPRTRGAVGFIGDPCTGDGDCRFDGAFCFSGGGLARTGYCTRACAATCPDRAGHATTRCARLPDGSGAHVQLCAVECASGCRAGTRCQSASSPSGASRSVCWAP